jgi:hypothetical protein
VQGRGLGGFAFGKGGDERLKILLLFLGGDGDPAVMGEDNRELSSREGGWKAHESGFARKEAVDGSLRRGLSQGVKMPP